MRAIGTTRGRPVWLLAVERLAEVPPRVTMPTPHFTVMLAMDRRSASDVEIDQAANALIERGAAYFVCYGPGCREIEDLIDLQAIPHEDAGHDVICTTSHEHEPLADAVFFFVDCAIHDRPYAMLAIVVGNDVLAKAIERELRAYCDP